MNAPVMQGLNLNTPSYVKNPKLIAWVADMAALTKPAAIYWCDGSEAEYQRLCQQLVDAGTFKKLNPAKRPNSFLAFASLPCGSWRYRPMMVLVIPWFFAYSFVFSCHSRTSGRAAYQACSISSASCGVTPQSTLSPCAVLP